MMMIMCGYGGLFSKLGAMLVVSVCLVKLECQPDLLSQVGQVIHFPTTTATDGAGLLKFNLLYCTRPLAIVADECH